MPRGRPRKLPPNLPAHIDYARVPKGIFWDRSGAGRWYRIETDDEGKRRAKTVAGAKATLSDLHRIAEQAAGVTTGSVAAALAAYHGSTAFKRLAPRTQKDYKRYRSIVVSLPTKLAGGFGHLAVARLSPPVIQALIESIGQDHPTKANHLLSYMRRAFGWGLAHGACPHNPCVGVEKIHTEPNVTVPALEGYMRMLAFATERAARKARSRGSCPPYLPLVMELAYLCRLRGVEVLDLSDASLSSEGLITHRRKGSRGTIVAWSPRLRAVVDAALELRKATFDRCRRPTSLRPEQRPLIVGEDGEPLTKSGLDSAWQRLQLAAVAAGVLPPEERFGLHAMKHRGITDTAGTFGDKQLAGGHKSQQMTHRYDHSLPLVSTPESADFSGDFSGGTNSGRGKNA